MKTITGDILDITTGVICHQVNCQRVAGAGLALQIRRKYPEWYHVFMVTVPWLGKTKILRVTPELYVANLYAQNGYGTDKRYTNYAALGKCLMQLDAIFRDIPIDIYFPYGIGCGLAGGDWSIVEEIIKDALPNAIIVQLP
uniref:Macro domain-containing protein n=1 Tax=viral metagenome TaxID=1070528 RepID=A0A6M3IRT1_9ZZZZ